MKLSTALAISLAPLTLANSFHSVHVSVDRRSAHEVSVAERMIEEVEEIVCENPLPAGFSNAVQTEIVVLWYHGGGDMETQVFNPETTVRETVTVGTDAATTVIQATNDVLTTVAPGTSATVVAAAATHTVTVGGAAGLVYTPDQLEANVNDVVLFVFHAKNHTATQVSFNMPCIPIDGGLNTGFVPNIDNSVLPPPTMAVQVAVSSPIWFSCQQPGHCGKGMVFSLNPTAAKTAAEFQQMAIALYGNDVPTAAQGNITAEAPAASPGYTYVYSVADSSNTAVAAYSSSSSLLSTPLPTTVLADSPTSTGSIAFATGTVLPDGSCQCVAVCASGAFPLPFVQGLNAFGGYAGALPSTMALVT